MKTFRFTVIAFALLAFLASGVKSVYAQQEREQSAHPGNFDQDNFEAVQKWLHEYENPDNLPDFYQIRYEGIQQLRAMPNPSIRQAAMKAVQGAAWRPAGISQTGTVSGRTAAIAFDSSGGIYLGEPNGGLWKSMDNGATWKSLSDSWPTQATSAVAIDPKVQTTIYAATGEGFGGLAQLGQYNSPVPGYGIWKSVDGGLNWTNVGKNLGPYFNGILINPANTNIVYVAGTSSIIRSTDAGATWSTVVSLGGNLPSLVLDPVNPAILYAASGGSLMKSIDSGAHWTKPTLAHYPTASDGMVVLGMTPLNHLYLYASTAIAYKGLPGGVISISRDSGAHWDTTFFDVDSAAGAVSGHQNYLAGQGYYANALAVSPSDTNIVVFGGLDVWWSNHNGSQPLKVTNWNGNAGQTNYTHADIHVITFHNGVGYTLSDGGIYYSKPTEKGQGWNSDMNADLMTFQQVGGDAYADPGTGDLKFFISGAQDNGTTKWWPGNPIGPMIVGGDGGRCFVGQKDSNRMYASYPAFAKPPAMVIYKSVDGGKSFSGNVLNGLPMQSDVQSGYMFYDVCESNADVVAMCGATKVWLTTDGFANPPTSVTLSSKVGAPSYVHVGKLDPSFMYMGNSAGTLYWSSDEGTNWTKMTTPTKAMGRATWITTDPGDPTMVYLTTSNATGKPLWTSQDNGQNWTQPTQTGIPVGLYRAVAVDAQGNIFMGGDGGVVVMDRKDSTWTSLITGFPTTMVTALQVRGHNLIATTYGRGMFYIDLRDVFGTRGVAEAAQPSPVSIESVYPNPVTTGAPTSNIRYSLEGASLTHVAVYDNLGREERVLLNEWSAKGEHEKSFDLSGLPAGQHYIMLSAAGVAVTKAITIE